MTTVTSLPPVASNFFHPCKKCGADRYHKVLAHVDAEKAKIECEVCGSKKTYRLPKAKAVRKTSKAVGTKARRATVSPETVWQELEAKWGDRDAQPYQMGMSYTAESVIQHPKFGKGFVTGAFAAKIEVAFQDSARTLVHNRRV